VTQLHNANPSVHWRTLQIGQKINIPVAKSANKKTSAGGKHTVKKGENDNTIAKKYSITVSQLHEANKGVNWRTLQIGQKINLPGGAEDTSGIQALNTEKVKVAAGAAHIRTEPNTNSRVRTTVDQGTVATVLDKQGAWYELRFPKGTVGWVRGDLLAEYYSRSAAVKSVRSGEAAAPSDSDKASAVVDTAESLLGVRYKWGGTSRGGVDCSGLTTYAFSRNGITLPRTSIEQSKIGKRVDREDLEPGDLLFFITGRNTRRINHVGLYVGDGKFIHASSFRGHVLISPLSDYARDYAGARRVAALQKKETGEKAATVDSDEPKVSVESLFPSRFVYGEDKTLK
ncbi:MAG TPA: NlpC/P60 family protein, partial [Fimbriimonadaceae bacterium]|nr:NlpC/P60 family protein [Fimbriimonadaceae bacterium]